ncbi:hypothetical protein HDU91_007051 [Kappamyces sp. JEL0680]|nr:hypothetical protein HDU91_007051 [Kappamyces sp. JEL0680]
MQHSAPINQYHDEDGRYISQQSGVGPASASYPEYPPYSEYSPNGSTFMARPYDMRFEEQFGMSSNRAGIHDYVDELNQWIPPHMQHKEPYIPSSQHSDSHQMYLHNPRSYTPIMDDPIPYQDVIQTPFSDAYRSNTPLQTDMGYPPHQFHPLSQLAHPRVGSPSQSPGMMPNVPTHHRLPMMPPPLQDVRYHPRHLTLPTPIITPIGSPAPQIHSAPMHFQHMLGNEHARPGQSSQNPSRPPSALRRPLSQPVEPSPRNPSPLKANTDPDFRFDKDANLSDHSPPRPIDEPSSPRQESSSPADPATFVCICKQVFHSRITYDLHVRTHRPEDRAYVCAECQQDLKRHAPIHFRTVKPFSCPFCSTQFTRNDALSRHLKNKRCSQNTYSQEYISNVLKTARLNRVDDGFLASSGKRADTGLAHQETEAPLPARQAAATKAAMADSSSKEEAVESEPSTDALDLLATAQVEPIECPR